MATRRIATLATTGWNVYAIVQRLSDGKVFDWADSTWKTFAAPPTTPGVALTSLASYGGSQSLFGADLNLSTINATATPVDVQVSFLKRAGGSPAPATDTLISVADPFSIVNGALTVPGAAGYSVDCTVDVTTTAGTSASVKVQLRDASGALVDLDGVSATCAVDVQRDGVHTQFTLSTSDFGSPNTNGWFEATKANPNFTTDVGYTAIATIVVGGVTYIGLCNFVVWP